MALSGQLASGRRTGPTASEVDAAGVVDLWTMSRDINSVPLVVRDFAFLAIVSFATPVWLSDLTTGSDRGWTSDAGGTVVVASTG